MTDDDLLQEGLSRPGVRLAPGLGELVRLAEMARHLPLPGPDGAAHARMTVRFGDYVAGRSMPAGWAWLAGWLGAGPRPRSAVQRFAAGGVLLLASASSASAAAGGSPVGVAVRVAGFAENVVRNLGPQHDDGTSPAATPTPTEAPEPTPAGAATRTPEPTRAPEPTHTPESARPPVATPVAGAGAVSTPSRQPTEKPEPSKTPTANSGQETFAAGDAGYVKLSYGGSLVKVLAVQPNDGWTVDGSATSGEHIEVNFTKGSRRISFYASLEEGRPKTQVREGTPVVTSTRVPPTPVPTSTPTANTSAETYPAGDAGYVRIGWSGSYVTVVAVYNREGWAGQVTHNGDYLEVNFTNEEHRLTFSATLVGGRPQVAVR